MAVVLVVVGGQVQQDLPEPLPVGLDDPRAAPLGRGLDADFAFGGQGPDEVEGLGEQLVHVHRLRRQRQAPGLDAGDVQDLVDEPEQVPSALQDLLHALLLPGLQAVHLQDLAEPQDGVEWGTQLVTHPRQELTLRAVGPLSLLLGPLGFLGGSVMLQ